MQEKFEQSKTYFLKLRPVFGDIKYIKASNILKKLNNKSEQDNNTLKDRFVYIVDQIFKDLDGKPQ